MIRNLSEIIRANSVPNAILIFGEEEFLIEEAYEELKNYFVSKKDSFEVYYFDGEENSINQIVECALSNSFFFEKKAIFVRNFEYLFPATKSKKKQENPQLKRFLESNNQSVFLIITTEFEKLNGLGKLFAKDESQFKKAVASLPFPYKEFIEKFQWIEFPKVYESELPKWIENRCAKLGYTIDKNAISYVLAHTNPSLRELNNQIQKIIIFNEKNKHLTIDNISEVIGSSKLYNVFELQRAVAKRDLSRSLFIAEKILRTERQEVLLIAVLTKFFISLWKLHGLSNQNLTKYQLAGEIGVHYYFIDEYINATKLYSCEEIENSFLHLAYADEKLKSTSTNSFYLFQELLLKIMRK